MIKSLYKSLLVSTLTFSLLLFHLPAYAQTQSPSGSGGQTLSGVSESSMYSSITMLAIGFIASRLYDYKEMTTDIIIAAAGGAAFIYAEISSTGKFKELEKDLQIKVEQLSEGKQNQAQVDYIRGLKKSYTDAAEILKTKKMIQMVAAAAFAGAGVMAYMMKEKERPENFEAQTVTGVFLEPELKKTSSSLAYAISDAHAGEAEEKILKTTQFEKCTKKLEQIGSGGLFSTAVSQCGVSGAKALKAQADIAAQAVVDMVKARDIEAASEANKQKADAAKLKMEAEVDKLNTLKETLNKDPKCKIVVDGVKEACQELKNLLASHEAFKSSQAIPKLFSFSSERQKQYSVLEKVIDLFIPSAFALPMAVMFGLGGVALGFMLKLAPEMAETVDKFLFAPKKRAIVWGILAGLSFMASRATQTEIDKIEENVKKIDGVLGGSAQPNKTSFMENMLSALVDKVHAEINNPAVNLASNLSTKDKMPCLTGPGNKNCKSLTDKLKKSPDFKNLSPTFKTAAIEITDFADELSGATTLSNKAIIRANSIEKKHESIAKLLNKYQKPKEIKEQDQLLARFNSITAKVLEKSKMSAAYLIASYGGTVLPRMDSHKSPTTEWLKKAVPNEMPPAYENMQEKDSDTIPASNEEARDLKKYKVNDISGDKDESIFSVISNRYLKSFPKLLP